MECSIFTKMLDMAGIGIVDMVDGFASAKDSIVLKEFRYEIE
jgi:hypothetical protein